ncbi:MAG: creatininase family protein [Candidatus Heimdallarchaeota archaeon]|nr:creatininase family protein [Candidatus Heimdallarchaeota archaeon]
MDRRGLARNPNGDGVYSPTGIYGDPTLATKEKGKTLTDALVEEIINQVMNLIKL